MRLLRIALVALLAGSVRAEEPVREAAHGESVLYRYGARRVLVARGTPRERGLAHGTLLREEVRANARAFLQEWAIGRMGRTRAELRAIWDQIARHVPQRYQDELRGLAEGSGVPLEDLQLMHAVPSRYHCSGAAALPAVTADGKLYHARSLDYALDIGDTVRPQTNSLLLVSVPTDGLAHATVGWAGFIGAVTGMNLEGLAIGEMGSRSSDESYDGFPMIFLVREALRTCRNLQQAKDLWRNVPRTCGYNFLFSDPTGACAVECNRTLLRFFDAGDEREAVAPHYPIDGVVRRCNHFVDKELAATQREVYDPRKSSASSWAAYERQGEILRKAAGSIDAATMIGLLRSYPATHPCLHQAVMCPTDRSMWVSQAADPAKDPLAGAQNQPFLRYDLRALVAGKPVAAERNGTTENGGETEVGKVTETRRIEGVFAHEPATFAYRLEPLRKLGEVQISHLAFPSPGPSRVPENLTVHGEYYRPPGKGPFPTTIVLHILDGRFYVARLVAASLAERGVAALFIHLPYYGKRRGDLDIRAFDLPDAATAVKQAVRDIRRGAAWLRARPDTKSVGIVGVSLGSFVAQTAAGADGGFERCAFVLGGARLTDALYSGSREGRGARELLAKRGWTEEKVRATLAPLEPLAVAKGVPKTGVLMINCRADTVVPPESSRTYWEAIGRPAIVWYDGGHYALGAHVFDVLKRLGDHFSR